MNSYETIKVPWLMDKNIEFKGASNS